MLVVRRLSICWLGCRGGGAGGGGGGQTAADNPDVIRRRPLTQFSVDSTALAHTYGSAARRRPPAAAKVAALVRTDLAARQAAPGRSGHVRAWWQNAGCEWGVGMARGGAVGGRGGLGLSPAVVAVRCPNSPAARCQCREAVASRSCGGRPMTFVVGREARDAPLTPPRPSRPRLTILTSWQVGGNRTRP